MFAKRVCQKSRFEVKANIYQTYIFDRRHHYVFEQFVTVLSYLKFIFFYNYSTKRMTHFVICVSRLIKHNLNVS